MGLRHVLLLLQATILLRPGAVLAATAALVASALVLGTGVEFRTSRSELAPPDDPDQARWERLAADYGASETVVACITAGPGGEAGPEELRRHADRLAAAFASDPLVGGVFHRVDVTWFERHALHLADPQTLRETRARLAAGLSALETEAPAGIAAVNGAVAERIERGFAQAGSSGATDDDAREGAARLLELIRAERELLADPRAVVDRLRGGSPLAVLGGERARRLADGYLQSWDGEALFVFVYPAGGGDDLRSHRRLLDALRADAQGVAGPDDRVRVAFTGQPAMIVEEMDAVRRDAWFTSLVSITGVALLTMLVFRWRSHALLVLLALATGVIWTLGWVRVAPGYLNMITSSFLSTLIGVGVAYGIHPVSEYELEGAHAGDPVRSVRVAFQRTGAGVLVAAVTTSAAFFSIQLMHFRGFSELGVVAGVGVLLCLGAATVCLPALLVVHGRWRKRRDAASHRRRAAVVDRFWVERAAQRVCRFPRATTAIAIALTLAAAWLARGLTFSTDIFDLLPSRAESLRLQRKMMLESDLSPLFNVAEARDLAELREMRERARSEPAISRVESVLDFLPEREAAEDGERGRWEALLRDLRLPEAAAPVERDALARSLERLEAALAEATDAAFGAGLGDLVEVLEAARAEAEAAAADVRRAPDALVADWNEAQAGLLSWLRDVRALLLEAAAAPAPTLADLPATVRARLMTGSGTPLALLYPARGVFDAEELERFVAASRRVSGSATGFPLLFHKMAHRITAGFYRAVAAGAALVVLILLVDFRGARDALLALLPLAMGVAWMLGAMRILGLSFNFANLVAVPLIIGVGIDNGVHVIHRVRFEGANGMHVVLRHTGRAILIASLTTMIGFGSLALASHRGMASLGTVLLLGVGACLVTSTVVLPNLLVALGLVER